MRIIQIGLVVVAGLLGVLIGLLMAPDTTMTTATGTDAGTGTEISDREFAERVRTALVSQPEILQEAFYVLEVQARENEVSALQEAITRNYDLIENAPAAFIGGNPDGDVTIVEFFDYECGYCRRALSDFEELVAADGNIRVVYFELPILGERSQMAAIAAIAADRQGLYADYHHAAMGSGEQLTPEAIMEIAAEIGLDVEQLQRDMADQTASERIASNLQFAQAMQVSSTPTFVVGGQVLLGWNADRINTMIAEARAE